MSAYGNTASIFQLAFGLNAALPTVYFVYRRAHDSLARRLAEEMRIDPPLEFGERELIVVRHYVRYGLAMRNYRPLALSSPDYLAPRYLQVAVFTIEQLYQFCMEEITMSWK
jgi:hypothetical protein